jgi:hypothetical protein
VPAVKLNSRLSVSMLNSEFGGMTPFALSSTLMP